MLTQGARRVHPGDNRVELCDGTFVDYDYLIIATGPDLAFDEVEGLGPEQNSSRSATSIMPCRPTKSFKSLSRSQGRSSSERSKAHRASDPPMSSRSSSTRRCATPRFAIAFQ